VGQVAVGEANRFESDCTHARINNKGESMTDQEKAINEVLEGIEIEILKLIQRDKQLDGRCCTEQEEKGFQEALRLCRASLRARYIEEEEADDE
jgi:hypothetical protein